MEEIEKQLEEIQQQGAQDRIQSEDDYDYLYDFDFFDYYDGKTW